MVFDVVDGIESTPGVDGMTFIFDYFSGQGDVCGNNQVPWFKSVDYLIVSNIRTGTNSHKGDQGRARDGNSPVSHEGKGSSGTYGSPEQDLLDRHWAGIGINPDIHRDSSLLGRYNLMGKVDGLSGGEDVITFHIGIGTVLVN